MIWSWFVYKRRPFNRIAANLRRIEWVFQENLFKILQEYKSRLSPEKQPSLNTTNKSALPPVSHLLQSIREKRCFLSDSFMVTSNTLCAQNTLISYLPIAHNSLRRRCHKYMESKLTAKYYLIRSREVCSPDGDCFIILDSFYFSVTNSHNLKSDASSYLSVTTSLFVL